MPYLEMWVYFFYHVWQNSHRVSCMLWSLNWDEKCVKTASLGCTDVQKCKSLYTQAMVMRCSRCVAPYCLVHQVSLGILNPYSELDYF